MSTISFAPNSQVPLTSRHAQTASRMNSREIPWKLYRTFDTTMGILTKLFVAAAFVKTLCEGCSKGIDSTAESAVTSDSVDWKPETKSV